MPTLLFKLKNEIDTVDADATYDVGLPCRKVWSQRYTPRLSSGHSLTAPPGFLKPRQLLPHIPIGPHGIMVVRAWRGVYRQAYRSAPTPLLWLGHVHARIP